MTNGIHDSGMTRLAAKLDELELLIKTRTVAAGASESDAHPNAEGSNHQSRSGLLEWLLSRFRGRR